MRTKQFFVAAAIALGTQVSGNSASAVTFTDNFDSGPSSSWGNQVGNWTAPSGAYYAQNPSNFANPVAHSLVSGYNWNDFTLDVSVSNATDGGIWLRASELGPGSGFGASGVLLVWAPNGPSDSNIYWHVVSSAGWIVSTGGDTLLGTNPLAPLSLHITVVGNTYTAVVNGTITTTLTDSTYQSGLVGLYSNTNPDPNFQSFDNFNVDGTVSAVPEPSTWALVLLGFVCVGFASHRWRSNPSPKTA